VYGEYDEMTKSPVFGSTKFHHRHALALFAAAGLILAIAGPILYILPVVSKQDIALISLVLVTALVVVTAALAVFPIAILAALAVSIGLQSTWVILSGATGTLLFALASAAAVVPLLAAIYVNRVKTVLKSLFCAVITNAAIVVPVVFLPEAQTYRAVLLGNTLPPPITEAAHTAALKLTAKPDIVLLGFLSAIPDSVASNDLGIKETGMQKVLERHGLTRIKNAFSSAVPTRHSYDALLNLGLVPTLDQDEDDRRHSLAGTKESAVFDILRANGYQIETVTEDSKFGRARGPFIDRMTIAMPSSICKDELLPEAMRDLVFMGACSFRNSRAYKAISPDYDDFATLYAQTITNALSSSQPTIVMGHFRPPYHYRGRRISAPDHVSTQAFAKRYAEAADTASGMMDRILLSVEAADPSAVIFVFGDMGVGLSKPPAGADVTKFSVIDTYGVLAAVKYPGTCPALFNRTTNDEAVTTSSILAEILGCLSGGKAPPHETSISLPDRKIDPGLFVYE
jgi:hypothetical protein